MAYGIQMKDLFSKINNFGTNLNSTTINNNSNNNDLDLLFNETSTDGNMDEVNFTTTNTNNSLDEQVTAKEAQKAALEATMDQKEADLETAMEDTESLIKKLTQQQEENVKAAVKKVTEQAKNDSSIEFDQALQNELAGTGVDTTIIDTYVEKADTIGDAIQDLSTEISNLSTEINGLNQQTATQQTTNNITNNNTVNNNTTTQAVAFNGDQYSSGNPEVVALQNFLGSDTAKNMTEDQFKQHLTQNFGSVISVDTDGKVSVPNGHDQVSSEVFTELCVELEKKGVPQAQVQRTDPIGFKSDGWTFDFINDKNNDGKFNDKEEFVGAQNGWDELLAYDANKDGLLNGKELEGLQTLATKDGQSKISTAAELGVNSIDLNSFTKKNELDDNNNILAGNFNLDYKGKTVEGYQTLDTDAFLNKTYGHAFGMDMPANTVNADTADTANTTEATEASSVKNFISNILKNFKSNVETEKEMIKKMNEDYLIYA